MNKDHHHHHHHHHHRRHHHHQMRNTERNLQGSASCTCSLKRKVDRDSATCNANLLKGMVSRIIAFMLLGAEIIYSHPIGPNTMQSSELFLKQLAHSSIPQPGHGPQSCGNFWLFKRHRTCQCPYSSERYTETF